MVNETLYFKDVEGRIKPPEGQQPSTHAFPMQVINKPF